ncbi:subclass B3 metallo-beta-lactamase [Terricaulis silvestris]|uniref:Metallo-beta-lactamase L1 n=1 Tax=Terricaulis silvestris TaxID=2686094 RepID=A0A6I6MIV7_9CAUL|nr:subclass B3 metallo-beta-lactamase [Terricaulis silvestris]QGZ94519.1 Metallo-beta-lactamase L1 precursor [Terricaulis silvestris]
MIPLRALFVCVALAACAAPSAPEPAPLPPLASEAEMAAAEQAPLEDDWGEWNAPVAPYALIGNIHYVGVSGVSAFLITTPDGHFLLDGAFPQSAPAIIANIEALGFNIRDVKYLLNSHAHIDHAGGLARLQQASGATMVASEGDREALESGRVGFGAIAPRVRVDRVIGDGETLTLGGVTMTALITAGHTPGCTSWSMDVRGADGAPHRAFFHCSTTLAGRSLVPPAYPGIAENFRATFARLRTIEADVLLTNHPEFADLVGKRARQIAGDANAFVDAGELQRLNTRLQATFEAELARQTAAAN